MATERIDSDEVVPSTLFTSNRTVTSLLVGEYPGLLCSGRRKHRLNGFQELTGGDRFGHITAHSGLQEALTVARHGMRRHRDDGDMVSGGLLDLPNRSRGF